MKKTFIFLCVLCVTVIQAQTVTYPYPIIFCHGLASSDSTWQTTLTALGGFAKVYDVCLNHDGDTTSASLTTSDVYPIGWRDGTLTPSPTRLYVINFENKRFAESGHTNHKLSNQSAIMKQGVALKAMIQAVLNIETAAKVILVGHSMGGLEIREYLQRGFDGTSGGRGTNWVDQTSSSGHRVARVVTTGTPHLGSNHTGSVLGTYVPDVNEKSEACRDLRYPYTKPVPPASVPAPYLFGGAENLFQWSPSPHNLDVNCNGTVGNTIAGLSSGTTYNASMPLPTNIRYTYITSNLAASGQDGLVELSRMWLYSGTTPTPSTADTLLLTVNHLQEPVDYPSIIRGMDEPDDTTLAYEIPIDRQTKCFITAKMSMATTDRDVFKVRATTDGKLTLKALGSGSGIDSLIVITSSGEVGRAGISGDSAAVVISNATPGTLYYATVRGTATNSTWQNPYTFTATYSSSSNEGTVSVGTGQAYTSLTGAGGLFDAINTLGLSGSLTAVITSNLTEPGTFALREWTESGIGNYTLTIQPSGAVEYVISGNVDSLNGMIRLDGADRVTIDGRYNGSGHYLKFLNTTASGTTISLLNGVNDITIRNCSIEGQDSLNEQTALLNIRANTASNSGLVIRDNYFNAGKHNWYTMSIMGIVAKGISGISNVLIQQNEYKNTTYSIQVDSTVVDHWVIRGNSFYATDTSSNYNAIQFNVSSSSNDTIIGNYIGGQAPQCGGGRMKNNGYTINGISFIAYAGTGNLIANNTIQNIDGSEMKTDKRFTGISFLTSGVVRDNIIGHASDSSKSIRWGMSIASTFIALESNADSVLKNTIANIFMYCETHFGQRGILEAPATFEGIEIRDGDMSVVSGNKIYTVVVTDNASSMHWEGIRIRSAATVYNNMISFNSGDIVVDFERCKGISLTNFSHAEVMIVYNSVLLTGMIQPWGASYCLYRERYDSSVVTLKNNIFRNEQYGTGLPLVIQVGALNTFTGDYNDLSSSHPDSLCSYDAGTSFVPLNAWKSGTGQDSHSTTTLPHFVDGIRGDLHLAGSSLGDTTLVGIPIPQVSTDIDDELRNSLRPYKGADENLEFPFTNRYTITASAGVGGTIAPSGTVYVLEGNHQQFIVTSEFGYGVDSMLVDDSKVDSVTSYTFTNVTANHTIRIVFTPAPVTVHYAMADKWNMVSLPLLLQDNMKIHLFPTAVSDAFAYEGGYQTKTTLGNGIGYWVKFNGMQSVSMTGYLVNYDTVDLQIGWNMIGSISSEVPVTRIVSLTPGLILSQFFEYRTGYASAETLKPAKGYWVKSNIDGKILLSNVENKLLRSTIKIVVSSELPPSPPEVQILNPIPDVFRLHQNYPNPFNPVTVIQYDIPEQSYVTLRLYNILGEEIATLVEGTEHAGLKTVSWDAGNTPAGVYFYKISAGGFSDVKKLLLLR